MEKITWRTERRKLTDLTPAPYNPRSASEKERGDLERSLARFDLADPLIINTTNRIIGGHFRYKILQEQGVQEIDVRIPSRELTQAEEMELNLRLNKNLGEFDLDALANFDEEMLLDVGFSAGELDNIFDLELAAEEEEERPEVADQAISKDGDIYQLGEHRVMCGDSTNLAQVQALLSENGQVLQAGMVFTDPPYNVDYKGQGKNTSEGIENDNMDGDAFAEFIGKVFETMGQVMADGAVYYICSGWSSYPVFHAKLLDHDFYRAGVIIWVKNNASYGQNDYRYRHEWIAVGKWKAEMQNKTKSRSVLYGWKKGEGHFFLKTRDEYDVWEVPKKSTADYLHPTEKPVWLIEKAIANSSQRGWIVLDLFGGSGSTLIAAERLKRRGFIMEHDPKYVDVIVKRWEKYTKGQAVKVAG